MTRKYLIIPNGHTPFYTNWCDEEKFPSNGGTAINLITDEYSTNGKDWQKVEYDHL